MSCSKLRTPIRMVLFDLVGTILAPAVPVGETYAAAAARQGVRVDPAIVSETFCRTLSRYRYRPRASLPPDGDDRAYWREVVRESLAAALDPPPEIREEIVEELYAHYGRGEAWRLYPEVREVLESLQASGLPLGVLSNWDRRARRVLADLGLIRYFSGIFLGAELGAFKPDPRFYRLVVERLRCPATAILLVGDDPENDGAAPRSCGFPSWVLRRPEMGLESLPRLLAQGSAGYGPMPGG